MNKIKKIIFSGLICITLTNNVIKSGQAGTGGVFSNLDMLAVSSSTFNSNSGDGFAISDSSSAQVNSTTANNNAATGTTATNLGKGNSYWNNVTTNANGQHGFSADATYNMVMTNPTSNSNGANGLHFINSANITTNNAITNSNMGNHGASFSNVDALIANINSNNNVNGGINLDTVTNFRLAQVLAHQNGSHGIALTNSQFGQIKNADATGNGGNGFDLNITTTNVDVRESIANMNNGMGFNNNGGISNIHNQNSANNNGTNFSGVANRIQQFEAGNKNVDENALAGITGLAPETITISNSGVFTLTRTFSGQIIIESSNVTLDLGGNVITGDNSQTSGTPPAGVISVIAGLENIAIQNGTVNIIDGATNPLVGIDIERSDEIVILDIIVNNNSTSASSIGIQGIGTGIVNSNYFFIDNVIISNPVANTNSKGISIQSYNNVTIRHYITSQNGGTGLNILSSKNGSIENSTISNNALGGIVSGMSLQFVQLYTINNCNISANPANGIQLSTATGCTITNCSVLSNATNGILIGSGSECIIKNCNAADCSIGIAIDNSGASGRSVGCVIDACTISSELINSVGISILNSDKCKVQNCQTIGAQGQGIILTTATDSIINNCSSVGFVQGIQINESQNCSVKNCDSSENTTGVLISGLTSLNCQVKDCNSISNSSFGFQDTSAGSASDHFIGNVAHTNPTNYSTNIAPTTTDQITAGRYNNLSV